MKKWFFRFSVSTLLIFSIMSVCSAVSYRTTQIYSNPYSSASDPQINDNGYVVWMGYDGSDSEIFLYDGTGTTQITNNSYEDGKPYIKGLPQINGNGYVVWPGYDGGDWEIFLYDGSSITQITNNTYDDEWPQINDNGYVVWMGYDGTDYEIFLYDGTSTTQITNNDYDDGEKGYPKINANGYLVWTGSPVDGVFSLQREIYLYDGSSITEITNEAYDDQWPQINDNGRVVWSGYDGSDYEIFLYDGTGTIQLPDFPGYDFGIRINSNGHVVWGGHDDGSDSEIFLYDGTGTTQLTHSDYSDNSPQINDNGYVVWVGATGGANSNKEIFLYDGSSITQITKNTYQDQLPQINDNGFLVWYSSYGKIFMAEPIGSATASSKDLRITIPGSGCFTINIENLSPFDFTVSPSVNWTDTAPSDVTFTDGSVSVPAGQSQSVNLPCFEVGSEAQAGDYEFDILWTGTDSGANPVNITTDPTLHLVYSPAVGGTASMANKIELLMPRIAIATLIFLSAGVFVIRRFRGLKK